MASADRSADPAAHGGGDEEDPLALLPGIDPDPPAKRALCPTCRRPPQVCWCPFLPAGGVAVKSTVYILQHPFEESRCLSTTPILYHCLPEGHRQILRGPRFNLRKLPDLAEIILQPSTILLYPSPDAVPINDLPHGVYNLVVLDGTWMQARGVYTKNTFLHSLKKVKLVNVPLSQYVIRTQPKNECLSTLESVAVALEILEGVQGLYDIMTQPLRALCNYQIAHGAVVHQSKQHLIDNGLYKGQLPRRLQSRQSRKQARVLVETECPSPTDVHDVPGTAD